MRFVYLVRGNTVGVDTKQWVVRAAKSEERAEEFVDRLNDWCKDHNVFGNFNVMAKHEDIEALATKPNPFDPHMEVGDHGVHYDVQVVEMLG